MARRALTVCAVPGCPNAQPCPEHPARRGSTRAWRRLRLQVLQRDGTGQVEALAMGQGEWLTTRLEIQPDGPVHVWLGWDDVRGFQERDTGARA
jgi:hypothetical protein